MPTHKELIKQLTDSNNRKRLWIFIGAVAICLFIITILVLSGVDNTPIGKVVMEAMLAIFSAVFILAFIDFFKDEVEDEAHKEEIKEIFDNTINKEDGFINKIKNEQAKHQKDIKDFFIDVVTIEDGFISKMDDPNVDKMMGSCVSYYCNKLSAHYVKYIKNHFDIFRENFKYHVAVFKNNTNDSLMGQTLEYNRYFKKADNQELFKLKCYFSFKSKDLDDIMHDNSLFFCEILNNDTLLKCINDIKHDINKNDDQKRIALIELLNLKFGLFEKNNIGEDRECDVPTDQISIEMTNNGLLFSTVINSQFINSYTMNNKETYICYKGKISCKYLSDLNNQFYCIFSNPTIGNTEFDITFDRQTVSDIKENVDHITMLSLKDSEYTFKDDEILNKKTFTTKEAIFPRSGIVIQWK